MTSKNNSDLDIHPHTLTLQTIYRRQIASLAFFARFIAWLMSLCFTPALILLTLLFFTQQQGGPFTVALTQIDRAVCR